MKKLTGILCLTFGLMTVVGCDKVCGTNVPESTQLKNASGQPKSLELCKIPDKMLQGPANDDTPIASKIAVFEILANQEGNFQTDDYQIINKKEEGKDCQIKEATTYSSQIFLTSKSIFQVVLCRTKTDTNITTIYPLGTACPSGSTAQTQAIANCNATSLIPH